ncbi:MAG: hypothetical protein KatS3mg115_0331 [Candidatus Poribacteria bacterium]|nr:MAG: hypothetical protein KatS3mg115_0331 [Candidatus Poribacteria bacterium]
MNALLESGCRLLRVSSVYETEPVGVREQSWFLNAVLAIRTGATPEELYKRIKTIEARLGRSQPPERWGPREIDIDVLLWGERHLETEQLTIPHRSLAERNFVLIPLAEIAPERKHPLLNRTIRQLCAQSPDRAIVRFAYPSTALARLRSEKDGPEDELRSTPDGAISSKTCGL